MSIALYLPALVPLLAAALGGVLPYWRPAAWIGVAAAATTLGSGIALATATSGGAQVDFGLLRADALTAYLLIAVGSVALIACWSSVAQLQQESSSRRSHRAQRRYLVLVQLFLACMNLAVLAANLGLLWVAVEATTIVTAFLVGHRRSRESVEAAWKYVVLCSVGIAIAFLGTVCVYAAAVATGAHGITALDWTYLQAHSAELDHDLIRLAAGLILLGFGTKAGLAPMHSWLPDAHSQAPAPVSALMSGVLLSVSFYAILRYKTVIDAVVGPRYASTLLFVAAIASAAVAAVLLIAQRDYKRMLAYSSIEHMGLVALGTAVGGRLALTAVLLHVLGHGLAKAVAFCSAGTLLYQVRSSRIDGVRALAARAPMLAALLGLALVALLGMPPFSLFASELGIARAGFASGDGAIVGVVFLFVLIAFAAIARHVAGMFLGDPPQEQTPQEQMVQKLSPQEPSSQTAAGRQGAPVGWWAPMALGLAAAVTFGVWLGPLKDLLDSAAMIAGGR